MKIKQATAEIAKRKGRSSPGRIKRMSDAEFARLATQALSYEELSQRTGYTIDSAATLVSQLRKAGYQIPRMRRKKLSLEFVYDNTAPVLNRQFRYGETSSVLDYIIEYKQAYDGISPSVREICNKLDISSTSVVNYALDKLERQGFIRRLKHAGARSIMVIGGQWSLREMIG